MVNKRYKDWSDISDDRVIVNDTISDSGLSIIKD